MANQNFSLLLKKKQGFLMLVYFILIIQLIGTYFIVSYLRSNLMLENKIVKLKLLWFITAFGILLLGAFVKNLPIKVVLFVIFTVMMSFLMTIGSRNSNDKIVKYSICGAIVIFITVSVFAFIITSFGIDLSFMGFFLIIALFGLIVASLVIMLTGNGTKKTHKIISGIILILFSLFVAYDTNTILLYKTDVLQAVTDFYLDMVNLTQGLEGVN